GYTTEDHVDVIGTYLDMDTIDTILVNSEPIPEELLASYREEGAEPVLDDMGSCDRGLHVIRAPVFDVAEIQGKETIKHDPDQLAQAVLGAATAEKGLAGRRRSP
ncbi:MAG: 2-phospho-L-lactate transferase CofD family protein, partial [Salinibacter sp.]